MCVYICFQSGLQVDMRVASSETGQESIGAPGEGDSEAASDDSESSYDDSAFSSSSSGAPIDSDATRISICSPL